jgi:hypothetical protein
MWRSVFLHEFDGGVDNFHALPGNATAASFALFSSGGDPVSVQITPSRGFEYELSQPLNEVIGVSGRIRLRYPLQGVSAPVPILRVGPMSEFRLQPLPGVGAAGLTGPARGLLRVGATESELGVLELPHRHFVDVRFDWHTSGQSRLVQDGRLLGYQNAMEPGGEFAVDRIDFGLPGAPTTATNPRYQVAKVFVRVLRRPDALAEFSRLLPVVDVPDDDEFRRCVMRATVGLLAMVDRMRQFMGVVNQSLSQPWSHEAGAAEGPFTPEAAAAHDLAMEALVELSSMLRSRDFSEPDRFLDVFTGFLAILHDALPAEFEALAQDLAAISVSTEACQELLGSAIAERQPELSALIDLLRGADVRLRELAGVS